MVFITSGIGTGVVFDGQIYRGKGGVAGEFGHMTIGSNAPIECAAGSKDCWEAFASERAAVARYMNLLEKQNGTGKITFSQLIDIALQGDEKAKIALKETAYSYESGYLTSYKVFHLKLLLYREILSGLGI